MGVAAGMLAVPGTAAAAPPPGEVCHTHSYEFGTNHGTVHKPFGNIRQFTNLSSEPVTWTESITVSHTFTSTYTSTTTFTGGLNVGIISVGISSSTQTTIVETITVSRTSTSSTMVNPGQTKYMSYGSFGLSTSGTYHQKTYSPCYAIQNYTLRSGPVTGYSLTSVGWRVWQ